MEQRLTTANWDRLQELLEEHDAKFNWDAERRMWCLSGEKNGNLWETDDYDAVDRAEAVMQAVIYLEQDGQGF